MNEGLNLISKISPLQKHKRTDEIVSYEKKKKIECGILGKVEHRAVYPMAV